MAIPVHIAGYTLSHTETLQAFRRKFPNSRVLQTDDYPTQLGIIPHFGLTYVDQSRIRARFAYAAFGQPVEENKRFIFVTRYAKDTKSKPWDIKVPWDEDDEDRAVKQCLIESLGDLPWK